MPYKKVGWKSELCLDPNSGARFFEGGSSGEPEGQDEHPPLLQLRWSSPPPLWGGGWKDVPETKTDGSFVHSSSEMSKFITPKVPSNGRQSVNTKDKVISVIPRFTVGHFNLVKSEYPAMNNVPRLLTKTNSGLYFPTSIIVIGLLQAMDLTVLKANTWRTRWDCVLFPGITSWQGSANFSTEELPGPVFWDTEGHMIHWFSKLWKRKRNLQYRPNLEEPLE